ncbi:MAG TPA: hypothetical protein VIK89_02640 [Cytophagaceae bacterium]
MKSDKFPIIVVSLYLLLYTISPYLNIPVKIIYLMFALSPLLLIWMVYSILKFGKYNGRALREGEEWGYSDLPEDYFNK